MNLISKNENLINSKLTGINANGVNSVVNIIGSTNSFIVNDSGKNEVAGIKLENKSYAEINSTKGDISFDIKTNSAYAYGLVLGRQTMSSDNNIKLNALNGSVKINILAGDPETEGGNVAGMRVKNNSSVNIQVGQNINIITNSQVVVPDKPNEGNNVSGISVYNNAKVVANAGGYININSSDINATNVGLRAELNGASISLISNGSNENNIGAFVSSLGYVSHALMTQDGKIDLTSNSGEIYLSATGLNQTNAVFSQGLNTDSAITLDSKNNDINLIASNSGGYNGKSTVSGIYNYSQQGGKSFVSVKGKNISLLANSKYNMAFGIQAQKAGGNSDVSLVGDNVYIKANGKTGNSYGVYSLNSFVNINATNMVDVSSNGYGVYAWDYYDDEFAINVVATNDINIYGYSGTVYASGSNANVSIKSLNSSNILKSVGTAIYGVASSNIELISKQSNELDANTGIWSSDKGTVKLSGNINDINAEDYGIFSDTSSTVELISNLGSNEISSTIKHIDNVGDFGTGYSIYSLSGSSVILDAGNQNSLLGAVYAEGANTSVRLTGKTNTVLSYAQSSSLGDLNTEPAFDGKKVISALYAEEGANISVSGDSNILRTYAEYENDKQLERVVWAYNGKEGEKKGSSIFIDGYSYISTDSYEKSPNSLDVAIAAGTATKLDFDTVNKEVNPDDRAKVTVTYADTTDEEGNLQHSFISGDILAAYEGLIDITPKDDSARITINGNLLAGNNGIVNVNLGQGGILTGRVDDYGDAGVLDNSKHTEFFNPAFSSTIYKGGEVKLTMGEGSRWNVTGQSWITRINASQNAITKNSPMIDLISSNTDRNEAAHALTVYELTGNAIFNMSLDADRDVSDMLYIKNADGEYTVNVIDAVSHDDMYAGGLDGLRFATVGAGSKAKFRALTYNGGGVNNIEYQIGTDAYAGNDENSVYNGDNMSEHKPGDSTVDEFFESSGKPGEAIPIPATQTLSLAAVNVLAADSEATVLAEEETAAPAAESGLDEVTNFKLVGVESSEISDAGKTIVDMSRANYANAVYMDTLNKRQGEARFVGDIDHGVWVRLRHDNIGKDDSFRTHDTMVEVGFDQRDIVDSGEFHTGFALDYMNGQIDYHTVDGDGDIERYGIWFYTTYLGNDGQYADLVLKYGHLKNDFDFNLDMTGVNVNGDYTNEVASISAEYGWKFSNSYNYYVEPQAQLQYSYVTGADYTTSYGTKVELDSIHSLIGRIGFRAGKDFNTDTPITAYIRGDVLHEFLGDQDIYAYDNTGVMDVTYENDDTWYSAGLGISVQSSENTYFFLEGEQVFGADNDNTYTVSGGFKHSF